MTKTTNIIVATVCASLFLGAFAYSLSANNAVDEVEKDQEVLKVEVKVQQKGNDEAFLRINEAIQEVKQESKEGFEKFDKRFEDMNAVQMTMTQHLATLVERTKAHDTRRSGT